MSDVKCDIVQRIGIIKTNSKTEWTRELNIIDWGAGEKFDLRDWNPSHTKCSKGLTFDTEEAGMLCKLLQEKLL